MKNTKSFLMLGAGLLAGMLSHHAIAPLIVHAQSLAAPATEIRAQRFVLVNEKGEVGGVIAFDNQGAGTIRLYWKGREIFNAGPPMVHPLAQSTPGKEISVQRFTLTDQKGETAGIIGFDKQGSGAIALYDHRQETYLAGPSLARPLAQ